MLELLMSAEIWAAFFALVVLELVLGIDNLIFISIIADKLPKEQQPTARKVGIGLALILRLIMLTAIAWIIGLKEPLFDLGIEGPKGEHGAPSFETAFSARDLILIVGGLFLVWKAATEIKDKVDFDDDEDGDDDRAPHASFAAIIAQIVALDVVFSLDSILTAIGMTTHVPVMVAAIVIAVGLMMLAAEPISRFVHRHPSIVMLALAFLLMIGMVLIADGFGQHVPKGYIYAAMAFAAFVEGLNLLARRRRGRLGVRPEVERAALARARRSRKGG
ncbi:MAG: TerC family protein [Neomegalonema sp.]|nr:TerC family protein [Neomegalonema sp.]